MAACKIPGLAKWRAFAAGTFCPDGKNSYQSPTAPQLGYSNSGWWINPVCRGANRKPGGYNLVRGGRSFGNFKTPQQAAAAARRECEASGGALDGTRKRRKRRKR